MKTLLIIFIFMLVFAAICMFALALSARIVYGFRWRAIAGFERQYKRRNIAYVSRAMFNPTAVYWLGSEDWQEDLVAHGMASGKLLRFDTDVVSTDLNHEAVINRVAVWPSVKTKEMYGKPQDVAPSDAGYSVERLEGK